MLNESFVVESRDDTVELVEADTLVGGSLLIYMG